MPSAIFSERYGAVVQVMANARRAGGLTQVQLAAKLGKPQSYVSKIERRERRVDPVEVHDWAVALGMSPLDLFSEIVRTIR